MRLAMSGFSAVLLTVGCEAWQEDYEFVWHGEHVTVYGYGYTEADVCGGSFAEIEGHTTMITDELGIHGGAPYVYRWLSGGFWAQLDDAPCQFLACAPYGEAISRTLPHMHELVHAMTYNVGDDGCPRLLDEGLAVYYSEPSPLWDLYPSSAYPIGDLMANGIEPNGPAYARAAHFVSFLVETYGPRSVVQLCEALPLEPRMQTWDAAVRSVYGISLEQLLDDYEPYERCSDQQLRARLWGCSGPPDFTFTAASDELVVEAGCEDPQATNGAFGSTGDAQLLRRVYFTEDRWVRVLVESAGTSHIAATVVTQECAACSEDPDVRVGNSETGARLYRAGMHEVSVFFDKRDQVRLTMTAVY